MNCNSFPLIPIYHIDKSNNQTFFHIYLREKAKIVSNKVNIGLTIGQIDH